MRRKLLLLSLMLAATSSLTWPTNTASDIPSCVATSAALSDLLPTPPEPTVSALQREVTFEDYVIRIYVVAEQRIAEDAKTIGTFEVWKNGHLVCRQEGHRYGLNSEVKDYTGNGISDLVIGDCLQSGRSRCWLHVFELGTTFRYLTSIYVPLSGEEFVELDGDSIPELTAPDWTFAGWKVPFGGSPAPQVILRFENGTYRLASDLMRQPAPSETELALHAQEVRNYPEWRGHYPVELWKYMLDLIYTGHADLAWQFLDMAWPPEIQGQTKFLAEFMAQLASSPYWPELRKMNNFDFDGYWQNPN